MSEADVSTGTFVRCGAVLTIDSKLDLFQFARNLYTRIAMNRVSNHLSHGEKQINHGFKKCKSNSVEKCHQTMNCWTKSTFYEICKQQLMHLI